jgi:hypothetical protein
MRKTREFTNKLLEAIDNGLLDRDQVILACLGWMSESSVEGMCEANEFFAEEEEEEWTPDNADFNDKGSRHHY